MKTLLITGVNGFVGSHLASEMARRGWRVHGTTRNVAGLSVAVAGVECKNVLDLGAPVDEKIFTGVDAVVHCAYDLRRAAMAQNVVGTERVVEAAAAAGVTRQVFISSTSAHEAAASEYGRTKFILQRRFLALGHAVVRPGLIVGPGGMFARMVETLRWPVVPLAGGGRDRVPVVALSDFLAVLAVVIVGERRAGAFNLFNPDMVTMKELFAAIRAAAGSRVILAPVPAFPLMALARLAETIGVRPPVDAESLRALKANQKRQDRSDLGEFLAKPLALAEMVDAALREISGRKKNA
jgi:nucleoside-diphosphate-sugar epimerase